MENKSFFRRVRRFFKWWVIVIILILVVGRITLPYIVLKYVNKQLHEMKGYDGHVDDIDIRLIRGAYVIENIKIWEINNEIYSKDSFPFFNANKVDLAIEWKSLLKGSLVGKVAMENPVINFKRKKVDTSVASFQSDTTDFRTFVRHIMPLKINSMTINNGQIHYIDLYANPQVDLMMHDVNSTALNLTNVENRDTLLPSTINATGKIYGGNFNLNIHLDVLNKQPTFEMNAELENMNLPQADNFFKAYTSVDVSSGTFSVYTEFAAKEGKFKGYVKPLLKDMHVAQWQGNVGQKLWEALISGVAFFVTNHVKDQVATKVNIDGDFKNPHINTWSAIKFLLINAYIQALKPTIDHTININNVPTDNPKKTILKKIFPKKSK